jgi:2'-5' RNA ligase
MTNPNENRTTGYHLFLEPSGALREQLQQTISTLADVYGGPVFVPHVTLLAQIPASDDIEEKTRLLAENMSSFTLSLGEIEITEAYFRALYGAIRESAELRAVHQRALEVFGMSDEIPYTPHLSLLYGNYPQEQKQETAAALVYPQNESFEVSSLVLYKTEGEVDDWIRVGEFYVNRNAPPG